MGTLILPTSSPIYVDSNTVIYAVEQIEPYSSFLEPLWQVASTGQVSLVTSELTWLETLAKPIRDRNALLESLFRAFLTAREMQLVPATLAIWDQAARLRAMGFKTPDALHAATALSCGCTLLLTNDPIFARAPGLPVTILGVAIGL